MRALAVGPGSESTPSYDAPIEPTLVEEKPLRFVAQPGMLKVACVARGVEGVLNFEF